MTAKSIITTMVSVILIASFGRSATAGVIITDNYVRASASEPDSGTTAFRNYLRDDLIADTFVEKSAGSSHSRVDIDYSMEAGQYVFSHGFTQARGAGTRGEAASFGSFLEFTVDESIAYELDGFYEVDDIGEESGQVRLRAYLQSVLPGGPVMLVDSYQASSGLEDTRFELGGLEGDLPFTKFEGSLTGTLAAGDYRLYFQTRTEGIGPNLGATARGDVTLTLGTRDVGAVPEPTSLAIFAAAGIGLLVRRRVGRRNR